VKMKPERLKELKKRIIKILDDNLDDHLWHGINCKTCEHMVDEIVYEAFKFFKDEV